MVQSIAIPTTRRTVPIDTFLAQYTQVWEEPETPQLEERRARMPRRLVRHMTILAETLAHQPLTVSSPDLIPEDSRELSETFEVDFDEGVNVTKKTRKAKAPKKTPAVRTVWERLLEED